jgi:thymidylate synthase (FAD)
MILIKPSFEIMAVMGGDNLALVQLEPQRLIEKAGRTCYKSDARINVDSAKKFIQARISDGHESVLEHSAMMVRFIIDRGVSHELVRHRLAAFSQESTRYCNYKGGVTFIIPPWVKIAPGEYSFEIPLIGEEPAEDIWFKSMLSAEVDYIDLLKLGWTPQQARSVLPNSLKTEIVVTANFREWRHIFRLRCSGAAHPQMREIMIPLRTKAQTLIPGLFEKGERDYD